MVWRGSPARRETLRAVETAGTNTSATRSVRSAARRAKPRHRRSPSCRVATRRRSFSRRVASGSSGLPALRGQERVFGRDERASAVEPIEAPPAEPRSLAAEHPIHPASRGREPCRPAAWFSIGRWLPSAMRTRVPAMKQETSCASAAGREAGSEADHGRRGTSCRSSRLAPQSRRRRFLFVGAIAGSPEQPIRAFPSATTRHTHVSSETSRKILLWPLTACIAITCSLCGCASRRSRGWGGTVR